MKSFINYYQNEKESLEKTIDHYNNKLVQEDNEIIRENLEYFKELNSNGKLIRGILIKLGYSLLKDDTDYSNSLALAYELFQTSILIHDDIIDKDEIRRGSKTIHYRNEEKYSSDLLSLDERKHLGNSIALCVGDYGLYCANKVISDSYKENSNLGNVLSYFNDIVLKTIKGELLDVVLSHKSRIEEMPSNKVEDAIQEIYRLKTAYYTIIGPMVCGLILAGGDQNKQNDLTKFGEKVGIAFQIQDDLLGIFSDEIGKVVGSDIREYKQTILYSHIIKTEYKEEFLKYYGKENITKEMIEKVRNLLEKSGSKDYAINKMNEQYNDSIKLIQDMNWMNEEKKQLLIGFVEYLRNRKK